MSREIEIRDRITRLDPAAFQNLAQELLTQHFRYDKPVHRGSATRSAATAPGTPDTIWLLPHNKFAYLECGHYPDRAMAREKSKKISRSVWRPKEKSSNLDSWSR